MPDRREYHFVVGKPINTLKRLLSNAFVLSLLVRVEGTVVVLSAIQVVHSEAVIRTTGRSSISRPVS
jgi:hypothetical protein